MPASWAGAIGRADLVCYTINNPTDGKRSTVWTDTRPFTCTTAFTEDPPEENARPLDNLKGDVLELYEQSRTPERFLVAYKGGHVERNLLRELDLPATNLEHAGCPKFERLEIYPIQDCGQHRTRGHCAMVECQAFWQWMKPDSDPWGPDSGGSEQLRMARRPWLLDRK